MRKWSASRAETGTKGASFQGSLFPQMNVPDSPASPAASQLRVQEALT